jgi:PAS domain S-box-containing protein
MSTARILIVEDSFIVAYHLQTTLESEGHIVVGKCDSGEKAIELAEALRPDLVLMDIMINGKMDGIATAFFLKKQFNLPVVYITALTDKDTISRAKITEPYGYLTKPFEDREIFTVIEIALYKHDIETKLKQSEEKYFSTVNSISDAVVTIDRDFCVTYMNPSALAISEWTIHEAIGKPVNEILHLKNEHTQEKHINPVQCSLGSGNFNRMPDDIVLVGHRGHEVPIGESSLSPLLDNKGNFVGLIIIFKDMTEKRERTKLLKEMERQKIAGLIEGQEKERARIAKDLHDGLGQILNAIKMNVDMVISDKNDSATLAQMLDEAIQESVRISDNLLPAKLKDFDLDSCLNTLCRQLESRKFQISFERNGSDFKMPQPLKVNFYRIAQEAVTNAIKHSHAKNINVQLTRAENCVRLSVEDDGNGIATVPDKSPRNGLINMRDRAEIMQGKFILRSDSNGGTAVIVEVPSSKLGEDE